MKDYLIGIKLEHYIDEQYIRDRDDWIRAPNEKDAIEAWKVLRKGWLKPEEHKYIAILEVKEPKAYCREADCIMRCGF